MAVTLDATVGGASSNAYCTLLEANTYHETRLYKSDWTDADNTSRTIALVWATRLLNEQIAWNGYKFTSTQLLSWPRGSVYNTNGELVSSSIIPQFLKDATVEYAMYLIATNRTADPGTAGIKSLKAGSFAIEFDKYDRSSTMPNSVFNIIKFYGIVVGKQSRTLYKI